MSRLVTCPKGHSWELPTAASAGMSRDDSALVCPVCGARARVGSSIEQTLAPATSQNMEQTLPTPLPSPPRRATGDGPPERTLGGTERSLGGQHTTRTTSAGGNAAPSSSAYTIIRLHASGGLGCVNLARDEAIQREVALKQIQPNLADIVSSRTRFVTEAKITGQLEHPGIVPVYSMGTDAQGSPFYVMKFVRGRTLDEVITEYLSSPNPLVFRELLRRFVAVCQAIAYAHSRGVIHRDIKPQNIMLGDYGETLVLDWGLAKDLKDRAARSADAAATNSSLSGITSRRPRTSGDGTTSESLTMDGQVIGTPAYMAPEQASGLTELHAPQTDIFSLGAVLYKLLAGRAPNTGKSSTAMGVQNYQPPPPPSELSKNVPPGLEAICLKAMAPRIEDRYQRAMELSEAVQRWLDDTPLTQRKPLPTRLAAWAIAHPVGAILWATLALSALLVDIWLIVRVR